MSDETTVALLVDWLDQFVGATFMGTDRDRAAQLVLEVLTDAGLLIPPDAKVSTGWRVVYGDGERALVWSEHWRREDADGALKRARAHYDSVRLESRTEIITPWRPDDTP